ncbi:ABC transporter ATP-binding protein [Paenibacillus sp. IB182496]|uniref:ABC transporter ATP-binding protein n=1 Tax=Paenibacillus sabuli TaxID=2772509 RepID=A0A927BWD3_9BACL|nr:ABC transporter ATP-binding protein [Paenibacillus sabuli]MBD2846684.1 ABC transporter ATP-binding protein [Paenibacillus sabuli]
MKIVADKVRFAYGQTQVLREVSVEVREGEVLGIIGPNGSGKSTLLRCMGGIYVPAGGEVRIDGARLPSMARRARAKQIGYVPQTSGEEQPFTVLDLVLMGRRPHVSWGLGSRDVAIAAAVLGELGMTHLAGRYLNELSGGQRQKAHIARALAQEPAILLLDEPTSALDIRHQLEVLEFVRRAARRDGRTIVLVMHELSIAARYSDRLALLSDGRLHAAGTPEEVLTEQALQEVYGVEAQVRPGEYGLEVVPIRPLHEPEAAVGGAAR